MFGLVLILPLGLPTPVWAQEAPVSAAPVDLGADSPSTGFAVSNLGTLGGTLSEAQDINEAGRVVGYARTLSSIVHAFVYTDKDGDGTSDFGEMVDLGTLGGATSRAYGINEMGQVVGFADTASGDTHAFLYTDTNGDGVSDPGEMVDLGAGDAQAINDAGQVVGFTQTASGAAHATLWKGNHAR